MIDAKTGTSGGGRAAKQNLLLAEAAEAIAPYGVVGHRHTSEIEQIAGQVAGQPIQLQFTPTWCRWCAACWPPSTPACGTPA